MKLETDDMLEEILNELRSNEKASSTTNTRSETNEIQNTQAVGSKIELIGVCASDKKNTSS